MAMPFRPNEKIMNMYHRLGLRLHSFGSRKGNNEKFDEERNARNVLNQSDVIRRSLELRLGWILTPRLSHKW